MSSNFSLSICGKLNNFYVVQIILPKCQTLLAWLEIGVVGQDII